MNCLRMDLRRSIFCKKFVFIVMLIIFTGITVLTDKKMEKTND